MAPPSPKQRVVIFRVVSDVCCLVALLVAVTVLAGWSVGSQTLIRVVPGLVAMNPLTAVCFIASAAALMLAGRDSARRWLPTALGSMVALVGVVRLVGYIGWYLPIDRWLFAAQLDLGVAVPNRMAPNTALNFCLSGLAIVALVLGRYRSSQVLALGTASTACIALIGYAYSVTSFGQVPAYIPMALHTAVLFVLVAVAVIARAPERGLLGTLTRQSAGARVLRRMLPGLCLGPPVLGWLRIQGELAGLFSAGLGVALFAVATVVLGIGLAWLTARAVDRGEAERCRADEIMLRLAHFDHLTGLPNRSLFDDRLQQALSRAQRANGSVALMFLDLDGFKKVNDRLGHEAGDEVLKEAARRIQAALRAVDTAARLGGDEFVVVLEQVNSEDDIRVVANRLLLSLSQPFNSITSDTPLSGSLGVSVYPEDARAPEQLLSFADAAMYRAKRSGKGRVAFHAEAIEYAEGRDPVVHSDALMCLA